MTRQALIYTRISRDRVGAGLGVDRQERDCQEVADRLGWSVVGVRSDNDLSAYSGKRRPGYQQLLDELRAGTADAVVAWHTDRLHRSPVELEDYVEVCDRQGVVTQTVKAGSLDLATPSGRMVARQLGAVARFEIEHQIERQQSAKLQSARSGSWGGGRRPFGYAADGVTVAEAEAREVKRAADAVLAGMSLRAVATDFNTRGVLTSTGRQWQPTEVRRMLTRARNAGLRQHRGDVMGKATWPAVLEEDTWRALCARLNDPGRRTSPDFGRRWLGSGLYLCGVCGDTVIAGTSSTGTGGHKPGYRCRSRQHITRDAVKVDDLVEALVIERLSRSDAVRLLTTSTAADTTALHAEAIVVRARMDELAGVFAAGDIDVRQLAEGTARLRDRLGVIEDAIGQSAASSVLTGIIGADVAARWGGLDLSRRRAVVDALMVVTIDKARRGRVDGGAYFDPASVRIQWKGPDGA
ncbi:MAG: recombinase family protein [Mycobacteriales bacterium]